MSEIPGLLSVIIPNYNYEDFVGATIASVLAQSYEPIELIVVDDGSTDRSADRIRQALAAAGDRLVCVHTLLQTQNAGKLAAINLAIEKARGEFCIILDADDLLTPDYAARCVAVLRQVRERQPSVGFVYTDCQLIGCAGEYLARGRSTAFDTQALITMSYIPEPAVTLTAILKEAAPFDETIRRGTKHHKWLRIVDNGWIGHHLPEPLFSYRMHGANLSGIGSRVMDELEGGNFGERILSGYWPTQSKAKASAGA